MKRLVLGLVLAGLIGATLPGSARTSPDSAASKPQSPVVPAEVSAATCGGSNEGPGIPPPSSIPAGIPGFHAAWYGQSGYPTLCSGQRSIATVAYYNSGSRGWVQGALGQAAYLGTWDADPGQDAPTVLGGDGQKGSPSTGWPRWNRVATQPHDYVAPGQVAWFQFEIQAPAQPGFYRLFIRPLVEGATWMEDVGVYWQVTVLNGDGSQPGGNVSSRVMPPIRYDALPLTPATYENAALGEGGGIIVTGATQGSWTSEWLDPGFEFSQLIPSWNADTPNGTWIEVEVQMRTATGRQTRWWRMGTWAYGDETVKRTSVRGQSDQDGVVQTDAFIARSEKMTGYRMRVILHRQAASDATPVVRRVGAVVSDTRSHLARYDSPRYGSAHVELSVPRYSQEIHIGHYPQYDGGGEAWCSPTSVQMVLEYWGRGPTEAETSWVSPSFDAQVDYAARFTYDVAYSGTGNWPFNVAYAARFGLEGYVTQLASLNDAERHVAAGIPLIASLSHGPGALPGFLGNFGTNGHLLVITGFTASGDVIANDPAAFSNASVPRIYPRDAFARSWIGGSGGVVYVIGTAATLAKLAP